MNTPAIIYAIALFGVLSYAVYRFARWSPANWLDDDESHGFPHDETRATWIAFASNIADGHYS